MLDTSETRRLHKTDPLCVPSVRGVCVCTAEKAKQGTRGAVLDASGDRKQVGHGRSKDLQSSPAL